MNNSEEKKIKGRKGEIEFKEWLDSKGLGYLYIDQDGLKFFASLFKEHVKRPDFLVLIDSIGIIAVDVKYLEPFKEWKNTFYSLSYENELKRVLSFERLFRIPVWYSYLKKDGDRTSWYWISALKAIEVGERKTNHKEYKDFFAIEINEFVKIQNNDNLGKLYAHRLPSLNKISEIEHTSKKPVKTLN